MDPAKDANVLKSGKLSRLAEGKRTWPKTYAVIKGQKLIFYTDNKMSDSEGEMDLRDCSARPIDQARSKKRFSFEVSQNRRIGRARLTLATDSGDELESWLQALTCAAVPRSWPGGVNVSGKPKPLLCSTLGAPPVEFPDLLLNLGIPEIKGGLFRGGLVRKIGETPRGGGGGAGSGALGMSMDPFMNSEPDHIDLPSEGDTYRPLPLLKMVPAYQRRALVLRKLRLCSVVFDGTERLSYSGGRAVKRQTILELVELCDASRTSFTDPRVLHDTIVMIGLNLFRDLHYPERPEIDDVYMDPQWIHIHPIYDLLLHIVSLPKIELSLKKRYIDAAFVRQLMPLFNSADPRERDLLKTITHRIYSKLTQRRPLIRRVSCHIFFEFAYETHIHYGIAEMLEILASIVNGFAVPIKEEHKVMLVRALIPLHKERQLPEYHAQLAYCMALFVSKDHTLTRDVVPGILRYWPIGNASKCVMFINELEDVFEYVQSDDLAHFREDLAVSLAQSISGMHFQIADRALCLWNSEHFAQLCLEESEHREPMLRIIFKALLTNSLCHWHHHVRQSAITICKQYESADPEFWAKLLKEAEESGTLPEETPAMTSPGAGEGGLDGFGSDL